MIPVLSGLGTGLALIVAIGVQNTYLLRLAVGAGLRVVAAAVVVCAASDAVLIVAGVLGVGAVVDWFPSAVVVIRFVGAAFLVTYGVLAGRRALRPSGDAMRVGSEAADDGVLAATAPAATTPMSTAATAPADEPRAPTHPGAMPARERDAGSSRAAAAADRRDRDTTVRTAVLTMLVFTWANPHVYLDTLVFLGSVANQQGVDDRWLWTTGAVAASCLWFATIGFGGRLLRPLFARPGTWRVFDGLVAVVMLTFGVLLLVGV